jgi:hypothetical protein
MKPTDMVSFALGLGAIALGVFVPASAPYAIPAGVGAIMAAVPQVSALLAKALGSTPPKP